MRVGIIGSGFGLYGLLPAFNSLEDCQVISICGKKTERLVEYCKSIGLTKIYSSWEEMLQTEDLDAIALAVTPHAQYEIARVAMKKGIHIFAEKPLTATYAEAKELLAIAKKNKIITAVDFIFPEIDEWQKVKQLLDEEVYGKLQHISVQWDFLSYDIRNKLASWKSDPTEGGGALSFYVSHVLYYVELYGGEIAKTKSFFSYAQEKSKKSGESGVDIILMFKNGMSGQVHFSSNAVGVNKHQVIFLCEKATLILESNEGVTENFMLTVCTLEQKQKVSLTKSKRTSKKEDERVAVVKKIAKRFIHGVKNNTHIKPSFVEGVRVQKLIESIRAEVS